MRARTTRIATHGRARAMAALAALCMAATAPAGRAQDCRQALMLGLDVSLSVDAREFRLQRAGLARALLDDTVVQAMVPARGPRVELAVFEWSGQHDQKLLVDWTAIDSRQTLAEIAATLIDRPRQARLGRTGLGGAMRFARDKLLQRADCAQLTLDLSGDGPNNNGPLPETVRPGMEAAGIVVNALVIGIAPSAAGSGEVGVAQLARYFRENVIVGPAAFVEPVIGFEDYEEAIRRKLLRELQPSFVQRGAWRSAGAGRAIAREDRPEH